jgi:predicted small secreted protein
MKTSRQVMGALASIALASAALAGCGSTVSGAGGGGLCGRAGQVTSLVVVKRGPLTAPGHSVPHATFTVGDQAKARSVAEAACALPAMPSGAIFCPADRGLIYRLSFSADGKKLATVTADRTGCEEVRGLGRARWTARSPGFWRTLDKAVGTSASDARSSNPG